MRSMPEMQDTCSVTIPQVKYYLLVLLTPIYRCNYIICFSFLFQKITSRRMAARKKYPGKQRFILNILNEKFENELESKFI